MTRHKQEGWRERPIDLAILTLLARYRFLRGTSVQALVDRPVQTTNYSLRKLYDLGFIDKTSNQPGTRNNPYYSDIYQISPKGLAHLSDTPDTVTNLGYIDLKEPVRHFSHTMMICDALAGIEAAVNQSDCTFIPQGEIVTRAKVESLSLPYSIKWRFDGRLETRTSKITPDGVFGIKYPNGQSRLYLLEAEHFSPASRTTLKSSSTLRKVLAYISIRDRRELVFGKSAFHVLFVYPTLERTYSARDIIKDTVGQQDMFLFQHQPVIEMELKNIRPKLELFNGEWLRAGTSPASINIPV